MEQKQNFKWDYRYNIFLPIIIATILVLFFRSCVDDKSQQWKGKYEILEQKYQQKEKEYALANQKRQAKEDSLQKQIDIRDVEYQILLFDNNELEKKIAESKKKPINTPKDLKGLKIYYDNRYETNTEIINDKLGLPEEVAADVSYELEEGDNCSETVLLQDEQIKNQNQQIDILQKNNEDTKSMLALKEEDNKELKSLNEAGKENINALEKQVKTLNTKNTLNRILIPIALVGGGFVGYQIAK